jgi:hypothetical protein
MENKEKIRQLIDIAWTSYKNKVATGLLNPENEKMMQLQLALTLQTLIPIFEYRQGETIKVLLEVPVDIQRPAARRIIDIVILHTDGDQKIYYPIELKCFRLYTRKGSESKDKKRGAEPLAMINYWMDIENIEQYSYFDKYSFGTQLTLTDHSYFIEGKHEGETVSTFSTNKKRKSVRGTLESIKYQTVRLNGVYSMASWEPLGSFYFIRQESKGKTSGGVELWN